jgi:hypothetical protein
MKMCIGMEQVKSFIFKKQRVLQGVLGCAPTIILIIFFFMVNIFLFFQIIAPPPQIIPYIIIKASSVAT